VDAFFYRRCYSIGCDFDKLTKVPLLNKHYEQVDSLLYFLTKKKSLTFLPLFFFCVFLPLSMLHESWVYAFPRNRCTYRDVRESARSSVVYEREIVE